MSSLPKRTIEELRTEALIGRYRIIVVEGPSDVRHLQQWLPEMGVLASVVSVSEIDTNDLYIDDDEFGNRDRVLRLSESNPDVEDLRFLADLDIFQVPQAYPGSRLYTDFPSLESYALNERILTRLLTMSRRMPTNEGDPASYRQRVSDTIAELVRELAAVLVPLYVVRREHRRVRCEVAVPIDLRKFVDRGGERCQLDLAKVVRHLGLSEVPDIPEFDSDLTLDTLRPWAYGHDIARAFWALWQDLRQRTGIAGSDQLEEVMLGYVVGADVQAFPLFRTISEWTSV